MKLSAVVRAASVALLAAGSVPVTITVAPAGSLTSNNPLEKPINQPNGCFTVSDGTKFCPNAQGFGTPVNPKKKNPALSLNRFSRT